MKYLSLALVIILLPFGAEAKTKKKRSTRSEINEIAAEMERDMRRQERGPSNTIATPKEYDEELFQDDEPVVKPRGKAAPSQGAREPQGVNFEAYQKMNSSHPSLSAAARGDKQAAFKDLSRPATLNITSSTPSTGTPDMALSIPGGVQSTAPSAGTAAAPTAGEPTGPANN